MLFVYLCIGNHQTTGMTVLYDDVTLTDLT